MIGARHPTIRTLPYNFFALTIGVIIANNSRSRLSFSLFIFLGRNVYTNSPRR